MVFDGVVMRIGGVSDELLGVRGMAPGDGGDGTSREHNNLMIGFNYGLVLVWVKRWAVIA